MVSRLSRWCASRLAAECARLLLDDPGELFSVVISFDLPVNRCWHLQSKTMCDFGWTPWDLRDGVLHTDEHSTCSDLRSTSCRSPGFRLMYRANGISSMRPCTPASSKALIRCCLGVAPIRVPCRLLEISIGRCRGSGTSRNSMADFRTRAANCSHPVRIFGASS